MNVTGKYRTLERLKMIALRGQMSRRDIGRVARMDTYALDSWIEYEMQRGLLVRVRRGVYAVAEGVRL